MIGECVICGENKQSGRFWICKECSTKWGCYKTPYKEWPEWVKALINIEGKYRKLNRTYTAEEIPTDPQVLAQIVDSNHGNLF